MSGEVGDCTVVDADNRLFMRDIVSSTGKQVYILSTLKEAKMADAEKY